jgi:glycogen debranching enzyme
MSLSPLDSAGALAEDVNRYYVAASSAMTPSETYVLKQDDTFAVLDRFGDISPEGRSEQGLYHGGTKFVSMLRLRVNGQRPLLLSSGMLENNLILQVDLTNPDLPGAGQNPSVPYGTVHIARSKFCDNAACFERIVLSNYGEVPIRIEVGLDFSSDFADVFEVRGTRREARGKILAPLLETDTAVLRYMGRDSVLRTTRFRLSPAPTELRPGHARFAIQLESKQTQVLSVRIDCAADAADRDSLPPKTFDAAWQHTLATVEERDAQGCQIVTDNSQFNEWLERSHADLRMLLTDTPEGPYPYAGVPWFSTPFGRDAIWTALEVLWARPEIARGVLKFLSVHQAQASDADADAEPGKILHEMRWGEMAALREIPFGLYYGSIDSTPLYLMLAHKYFAATGDRALIEAIWPNLLRAIAWVERFGDCDGDGFVEYGRRSKDGLLQQGWKDSNDSVFHANGSLAHGPIALAEVQGYTFAALTGMAALARALGKTELAQGWQHHANTLRERFDTAFYCDDISMYALALDGEKKPCRVRSSNAGHCLYTRIALPERAASLNRELLSPEMFSGWGVRTLATTERRYNPMSYHNGSIWPHDNAIVAAGLADYGFKASAARILEGMFATTQFMNLHRLPELFCGFSREPGQGPTLYPVACSPQAWASGAVFMLVGALLGLEVDAVESRLVLRHASLPAFLEHVELRGLRVGQASIDLRLARHADDVGVTVMRKRGQIEVVAIK